MIIGLILVFIGTVMLCLSMKKHYRQVFSAAALDPVRVQSLRYSGFALLTAAAVIFALEKGTALGLTWFFAVFTVAIFAVAIGLGLFSQKTTA